MTKELPKEGDPLEWSLNDDGFFRNRYGNVTFVRVEIEETPDTQATFRVRTKLGIQVCIGARFFRLEGQ